MVNKLIQLAANALYKKLASWRFALFLLPWLVVLAIPQLRVMLSAQVMEDVMSDYLFPWMQHYQSNLEDDWVYSGSRLSRKYPHSLGAQVLAAQQETNKQAEFDAFDKLIQRHPDQTWLIAERLVRTDLVAGFTMPPPLKPSAGPRPAPVAEPDSPRAPPRSAGSITTDPRVQEYLLPVPNQPSPADLQRSMKLAQLGRQREPDNTFFDFILIDCLLLSRRNEEALLVLREAARKPYFDAHRRDNVRYYISALELLRPLRIEEKISITSERLDYRPSNRVERLLPWIADKAKSRGDHAGALQIYGDLLQLLAKMRDNRDDADIRTIGTSLIRRAVAGTPYDKPVSRRPGQPQSGPPGTVPRARARQFAAYAQRYSRHDLAQEALRQTELTLQSHNRRMNNHTFLWPYGEVISQAQQFRIMALWALAVGLGSCVLLLIGLRWIVYFPLWVPGLRHAPLQRRDLWLTALEYCIVTAAVVSFVSFLSYDSLVKPASFDAVATTFLILCPVVLLIGPITCAAATVWRHRALIRSPRPVYSSEQAGMVPRSLLPLFLTAVSWFLLVAGGLCWIAAPIVHNQPGHNVTLPLPSALITDPLQTTTVVQSEWFLIGGMILSGVCYVGWLIRWRWLAPRDLRPVAHYALMWHLKSLGDWMIVLSYAYLFVSVISLQPRNAADQSLQSFLQQGRTAAPQAAMLQQEKKK